MTLPKPCQRCGKRIENPTKSQKICNSCFILSRKQANIKIQKHLKKITGRQYIKCCKTCNSIYKSPFRFSKYCPQCDNSINSKARNKYKTIIVNKK